MTIVIGRLFNRWMRRTLYCQRRLNPIAALLQVPMTIVIGRPIEVPTLEQPTDEEVEQYLQRFIAGIQVRLGWEGAGLEDCKRVGIGGVVSKGCGSGGAPAALARGHPGGQRRMGGWVWE